MIYDVKSSTVSEISKGLLKSVEKSKGTASERKAFSIIENWDGSYLKTSVGGIYRKVDIKRKDIFKLRHTNIIYLARLINDTWHYHFSQYITQLICIFPILGHVEYVTL